MSFNPDTFNIMIKLAFGMIGILLLIWLMAVLTPKAAKLVDKIFGKANINKVENTVTLENGEKYIVKDIYKGSPTDEEKEEPAENNEKE